MLYNFSFVIPGKLAGMARPGVTFALFTELEKLKELGIGAIASLCEQPLDTPVLEQLGFEYLHLEIQDFTAPDIEQIRKFVEFVGECNKRGIAVAAHCAAGMGRTGTMLACYLVSLGETAEQAIDSVRSIRPGSIETCAQEDCVRAYEQTLSTSSQ